MKQILSLAALALVICICGEAQAACVATNCAIDEQLKTSTTPSASGSAGAEEAITPQLAKDLKDLSNATIHAMEADADHAAEPKAGAPAPETKH